MFAVLSSVNAGILAAGVLLLLSVFASKVSSRYGLPALVLFIAIGMLAGSEGFGGIHFDDYRFAYGIGVVALVLILFGGGLESNWAQIKPVVAPGLLLATVL
jgi:cell volume regulation protein A